MSPTERKQASGISKAVPYLIAVLVFFVIGSLAYAVVTGIMTERRQWRQAYEVTETFSVSVREVGWLPVIGMIGDDHANPPAVIVVEIEGKATPIFVGEPRNGPMMQIEESGCTEAFLLRIETRNSDNGSLGILYALKPRPDPPSPRGPY